ncbi:hypothetical protein [Bradyrhizobium japonicum]|uniref:hypothetical protein n=1 Tax=Bradyrhizobium japonicum TaxID=375 RepID=UPI001BAD853E|nr:hypothetical protein [Bradyrhizobium japonicum]MBR0915102.1 hypothetical protein [Bradyrhizobium japonicum]
MRRRDLLGICAGFALWPSFAKEEHSRPVVGFLSSRWLDIPAGLLARADEVIQ